MDSVGKRSIPALPGRNVGTVKYYSNEKLPIGGFSKNNRLATTNSKNGIYSKLSKWSIFLSYKSRNRFDCLL